MSRILIVEDSPTQALEMQFLLEGGGHEVGLAGDGIAALRAIRDAPPDLVVTDLEMPSMDGLALVEAVGLDFPFIPIVMVTARGSEEIAARALRAGASSYVPKRYITLDLVPTVANILELYARLPAHEPAPRHVVRYEGEAVLGNETSDITPLVRYLEDQCVAMRFCEEPEAMRVGTALREALVNAIERGNLGIDQSLARGIDPEFGALVAGRRAESPYRDRRVHVRAAVNPREAVFVVRDEGPGFMPGRRAHAAGRGLLLIRTFMDTVVFNDRGNEITMTKRGTRAAP